MIGLTNFEETSSGTRGWEREADCPRTTSNGVKMWTEVNKWDAKKGKERDKKRKGREKGKGKGKKEGRK